MHKQNLISYVGKHILYLQCKSTKILLNNEEKLPDMVLTSQKISKFANDCEQPWTAVRHTRRNHAKGNLPVVRYIKIAKIVYSAERKVKDAHIRQRFSPRTIAPDVG